MQIEETKYTLVLSRRELRALNKGLYTLESLRDKYYDNPDAPCGYDLGSESIVQDIAQQIDNLATDEN